VIVGILLNTFYRFIGGTSVIFVTLLPGCQPAHNQLSGEKGPPRPRIASEWWRICEMPDLGELAGEDPDKQHIVDHGFIRAANGKWQLWACIRGTAVGRILYRWEGDHLDKGPWTPEGIAARADSSFGERAEPRETIQAPYFLKIKDDYYCFYTSNGARMMISKDGVHYERPHLSNNVNLMYPDSGRDIMMLEEGDLLYSYSTISTVTRDGWKYGFIILRTSKNLKDWSDYTIVSSGGIAGNGPISAESPFVIKIEKYYYLFRSSSVSGLTYVYRSESPYHFGVNDDSKLIKTLPIKAPEIIYDQNQYYISDLADFKGIKLARLEWVTDK
jgi:hypothetical protein